MALVIGVPVDVPHDVLVAGVGAVRTVHHVIGCILRTVVMITRVRLPYNGLLRSPPAQDCARRSDE